MFIKSLYLKPNEIQQYAPGAAICCAILSKFIWNMLVRNIDLIERPQTGGLHARLAHKQIFFGLHMF